MSVAELPFAHGAPPLQGRLKSVPEDFVVDEILGFSTDGQGEHVFVRVEKRGANTEWVAKRLAEFAGVAPVAVGFAGMKDRQAVTRQTFSIQMPGRGDPDWGAFQHAEFRVLEAARHSRKLKRGALKGNRFQIVLREISGDRAHAEQRLQQLGEQGVPNYFGEQRFGRDGDNVDQALAMFGGRRVSHEARGRLLSAARSHLFNGVLAARVETQHWARAVAGDVFMLDGSHALFGPEPISDALIGRVAALDIHPTGPLWGRGTLRSTSAAFDLESTLAAAQAEICAGLERFGLEQERRALRLPVRELTWNWLEGQALELRFFLPAGAYATVVLRELCDFRSD